MRKYEKEVIQAQLASEKEVLKQLEQQYRSALNEINQKVKLFDADIKELDNLLNMDGLDDDSKAVLQSQKQAKVYQRQYQKALQGQISGILDRMQGNNYSTLESYLKQCYNDGFIGTMYDIAGQGIPLVVPIDQAAAVKAIMTDSKVSEGLYNSLGVDVSNLKKAIQSEITRGIATGMTYKDIARNISNVSNAPLSRAKTIARTEGHRIHQASTMDAQNRAKEKGADVVKQWDSALDGKTRPTHRKLDGQIREVDKPFEMDGKKAMAPGHFGDPAEDCNCRCVSLTRARWALDEDELATLRERAEFFGLDKTKDFQDFKKKYLGATKYDHDTLRNAGLQFFAIPKDVNDNKAVAFKKDLENGKVNLNVRRQKQNEHVAGTKERERRIARDEENDNPSSYFYEGTDVQALLRGLFGTGKIQYNSENAPYPVEYIALEKPIGKVYNVGAKKYVDVAKIAIKYGSNGVHAYPAKDW